MKERWLVFFALALLLVGIAHAHEKFVLSQGEIESIEGITEHTNVFSSLQEPFQLFIFFLGIVIIFGILLSGVVFSQTPLASKWSRFFTGFDVHGKSILRAVFGLAMVLAGLYQTLFLPDLVLSASLFAWLEIITGFFIVFNYATDAFAALTALLYVVGFFIFGWAMLDHIDVLGVAIYLFLTNHGRTKWLHKLTDWKFISKWKPHAFETLRIAFGLSLVISGITKKFLVPEYFMRVVDVFSLSSVFRFEPLFIVLMAGMIEVLVGITLIKGIQTRLFTIISVLLFTMMGILMNEGVSGHLIIYAILIFVITHKDMKSETWTAEKLWERWLRI